MLTIADISFGDPNRKLTISYPCVMLNVDVARNNTNDQYQVSNKKAQLNAKSHPGLVFIKTYLFLHWKSFALIALYRGKVCVKHKKYFYSYFASFCFS